VGKGEQWEQGNRKQGNRKQGNRKQGNRKGLPVHLGTIEGLG